MFRSEFRRLLVPFVSLALLVALAVQPGALAGKQRPRWTKLSQGKIVNHSEPALWRDSSGVLHAVWGEQGASDRYMHVTIGKPGSKSGEVGEVSTALPDWESLNNPTIVPDGAGGMRLLFSGIRTLDPNDPYAEGAVYHATSSDGHSWIIGSGSLSHDIGAYASRGVGGALTAGGIPVASWSWTGGVYSHTGIDPSIPATSADVQHQSECCGYHSNLATDDVSGETMLVWYSNATDMKGIWFRQVEPGVTDPVVLPGSRGDKNSALNPFQRVPLVPRAGTAAADGIYTAYCTGYPSCGKVRVLRLDDMARWDMPSSKESDSVQLATGASGRIWAMWSKDGKVYARVSNTAGNRWGEVVKVAPPRGTDTIWNLNGEGSQGKLDLIANLTRNGAVGFWHARVLMPLELRVKPSKIPAYSKKKIVLFVNVAGDGVANATVTLAGKTATTDADGSATIAVKLKPGKYKVGASATGFRSATATLKVVKP